MESSLQETIAQLSARAAELETSAACLSDERIPRMISLATAGVSRHVDASAHVLRYLQSASAAATAQARALLNLSEKAADDAAEAAKVNVDQLRAAQAANAPTAAYALALEHIVPSSAFTGEAFATDVPAETNFGAVTLKGDFAQVVDVYVPANYKYGAYRNEVLLRLLDEKGDPLSTYESPDFNLKITKILDC